MKLNIFVFKRKDAGFSFNPIFTQYDKEQYETAFKQNIHDFKDEELEHYKNLELHYIGTFDNVLLKIESVSDTFVLDCAPLACNVIALRGSKNGKTN